MSYRCGCCNKPQPPRTQRKTFCVLRPNRTIEEEVPVCGPCKGHLEGGEYGTGRAALTLLRRFFRPAPAPAAPPTPPPVPSVGAGTLDVIMASPPPALRPGLVKRNRTPRKGA